jgi:mycothiol synthase
VGTLSNIAWLRGLWSADHTAAVSIRPAHEQEIDAAIRLVACSAGPPQESSLREFTRLASLHSRDAGGIWVAEQRGKLIASVLPVTSPGKTMLLFLSPFGGGSFQEDVLRRLVEEVCRRAAAEGIELAQVLLDDLHEKAYPLIEACGFSRLAELLYLQSAVPRNFRRPNLPAGWRLDNYGPSTHLLFGRTILASYQQSFDCPRLNGMRQIDEIISGHRATGEFDPRLWFLVREGEENLGVLLLSPVAAADTVELVYLGVPPLHRGRRVGDLLVRQATAMVSESKYTRLSLAVDAGNLPALKVYWRHGFQAIGRKVAMLRDLRTGASC